MTRLRRSSQVTPPPVGIRRKLRARRRDFRFFPLSTPHHTTSTTTKKTSSSTPSLVLHPDWFRHKIRATIATSTTTTIYGQIEERTLGLALLDQGNQVVTFCFLFRKNKSLPL